MKIAIVSNYVNHHTRELCRELYDRLGRDFSFVATQQRSQIDGAAAFQMGYAHYMPDEPAPEWVIPGWKDPKLARQLLFDADAVITANASDDWVLSRLKAGKLTFRAHERWYRQPLPWYRLPKAVIGGWLHHGRFRNLHMLCASAYTAADTARVGCFRGKAYQWGYFPVFRAYVPEALDAMKNSAVPTILWAGRLIDWKHADDAVCACIRLKAQGFDFRLRIAGEGPEEEKLRRMCEKLGNSAEFLGALSPEQLRGEMERSEIFLFTSDFREGWGAVLNEAMNSGCAVVASHAAGATPCLVRDGKNGLIYPNGDVEALIRALEQLLSDRERRRTLGQRAYETIRTDWTADGAADAFLALCQKLLRGEEPGPSDGLCSPAPILQNNWYCQNLNK